MVIKILPLCGNFLCLQPVITISISTTTEATMEMLLEIVVALLGVVATYPPGNSKHRTESARSVAPNGVFIFSFFFQCVTIIFVSLSLLMNSGWILRP